RADIVFSKAKIAVFVDGCFWHGCPKHFIMPKTNSDYWSTKIGNNKIRDKRVDKTLEDVGWSAMRVWEHEDSISAADRIEAAWREATRGSESRGLVSGCEPTRPDELIGLSYQQSLPRKRRHPVRRHVFVRYGCLEARSHEVVDAGEHSFGLLHE